MKVSIDGILNSARRMKGQNHIEEESYHKKKERIGSDSVEISHKINTRLISIQKELNNIQSSLTKNQIIKEGIDLLISDRENGGTKQNLILNELKFENEKVLSAFIGDKPDREELIAKRSTVLNYIDRDTSSLKKLQIEVENILASNLAGSGSQNVIRDIEIVLSNAGAIKPGDISALKPETVMSLIN